eukprot:6409460-Karenia_brevis.AAC.1
MEICEDTLALLLWLGVFGLPERQEEVVVQAAQRVQDWFAHSIVPRGCSCRQVEERHRIRLIYGRTR